MKAPCPLLLPGVQPVRAIARRDAGFTTIELMVVVAIIATLTALAGPSFRPLIERWRVRDAAESLTATMYFARSEAIKRGGNITIVKNPNNYLGSKCTNAAAPTDWGCGWRVVFTDGVVTTDLQAGPEPTRMLITLAGSANGSITVDRWGMASHTGGANVPTNMFFALTPQGKDMTDASAARICAGTGGRIARKNGSDTC